MKLTPKNFNIKAKVLDFSSTQYMTDLEKKKIYISFVKFLNNHFKFSCFNKAMYHHFTNHCGFIAHYNLHGFYGEYFETPASFHYNVNGYTTPMHECMGNVNRKSTLSASEQFFAIYNEMNGMRRGVGDFIDTLLSNQNWGGYSDYRDLDNAIKDAISDYKEIWVSEIRKAIKLEQSQKAKEENVSDGFIRYKEENNKLYLGAKEIIATIDIGLGGLYVLEDKTVADIATYHKEVRSFIDDKFVATRNVRPATSKELEKAGLIESVTIKEIVKASPNIVIARVKAPEREIKVPFVKEAPIVDKIPELTGQTSIFDFFELGA